MINYRYNVLENLGKGGAGEVLLVEDTLYGHRVAMKILLSSAEQQLDVEEFRREFSILINVSHPNLVRVFDFGTILHANRENLLGRHFYTMEYLQGTDSFSYFNTKPLDLQKIHLLERLFEQVLGVLAYIHREGIIHFDIKPQNLIVCEGDDPREIAVKLTDFGLSSRTLESVEFPVRGTLQYAAPEMLRGLSLDSRVDLYSLGVTMYHLWEGRCPFEASSPVELVKKVLNNDLPPVQRIEKSNSSLPEIIETLCQREWRDRPEDALEVFRRWSISTSGGKANGYWPFFQKPKFVGRAKEKEIIRCSLESLKQGGGPGQVILVTGEEGMGKTGLIQEMIKEGRADGALVIEVKAVASEEPFVSLKPIVRRLEMELRSRGVSTKTASSLFGSRGKVRSAARESHPEISGQEFVGDPRQAIRGYAHFLLGASRKVPFLLCADDVEEMDEMSQATLQSIAEESAEGRVLLLVGVTGNSWSAIPFEADHLRHVPVEELSPEEVRELVRFSLGESAASGPIPQKLFQLYGGIPALLTEAVRAVAEVMPDQAGQDHRRLADIAVKLDQILPTNLEDFFVRRFKKLTKEQSLLLQALACFEYPPTVARLNEIVPMQKQRMREYLETLHLDGHLSLLENGSRCSVRQSQLGKYLYNSIGEARTKLHAFIASRFLEASEGLSWQDLEELGRHQDLAGAAEKASQSYEAAGDFAAYHQVLPCALRLFEKAIAIEQRLGNEQRCFSLADKLARAYFLSGSHQKSVEIYERLLVQLSHDDVRRSGIHRGIGKPLSRLGNHADALQHFERALKLVSDDHEHFEILQEIISLKVAGGFYEEAVNLCQTQKEFALNQPNKELVASVETNLGRAEFFRGNFEKSRESFGVALKIYIATKNKQKIVDSFLNLGNVLSATADYHGALEYWSKALEISEELGTRLQEGQIRNNMGIAHYKLRQFDEARRFYQKAREIFEELNSRSGLALALSNLGEVALVEGEYEQALELWNASLALSREMEDPNGIVESLSQLAQAHNILHDTQAMHETLQEAEQLVSDYHLSTYRGQLSYLAGILLLSEGKPKEARDALEDAMLEFRAGSEPEKTYLTRIRMAEALLALGEYDESLDLISSSLGDPETCELSQVRAELCYLMGVIARDYPGKVKEKPLVYFKNGVELIQHEMITELSWKLSCALGREYACRGQRNKASQHYTNAKLIIEHIASLMRSSELRGRYLSVGNRQEALSEVSLFLQQETGDRSD